MKYTYNTSVYKEGDPADFIYFIKSGEFEIRKSLKTPVTNYKNTNSSDEKSLKREIL